jgi:hypothetical protein
VSRDARVWISGKAALFTRARGQLLLVASVALVALAPFGIDALPWALCALLATTTIALARRPPTPFADIAAPQRHLMRLRRREEPAELLVVRLPRTRVRAAERLASSLRLTDGISVEREGGCVRIVAVLDGEDVPRHVVQERLEELADGAGPVFGWASFPADGVTLEALVEHAERAPAHREHEVGALVEPAAAMGTATP